MVVISATDRSRISWRRPGYSTQDHLHHSDRTWICPVPGLTDRHHGWTSRTPEIVRQLLQARGRLERFLQSHDQRLLHIVVVAEDVDAQRRFRLRKYLGNAWNNRQVFLRSGSPTSLEDLQRFGLPEAAAIVVPGDEFRFGGGGASDARTVKILLNLGATLNSQTSVAGPTITAEVFDPRKEAVAKRVLQRDMEVVTGESVVAQLFVQSIRDPRLVDVYMELLTYNDGCSPYIRAFPEFSGQHPTALNTQFEKAIVLGALRKEEGEIVTYLGPSDNFKLRKEDRLVFIARSYNDCLPSSENRSKRSPSYTSCRHSVLRTACTQFYLQGPPQPPF